MLNNLRLFSKNEFWIAQSKEDVRSKNHQGRWSIKVQTLHFLIWTWFYTAFLTCCQWTFGVYPCAAVLKGFFTEKRVCFVGVSGLARSFLRLMHSPCGKIRINITMNNRYELLCCCFHCCLDIFLMNMNHEYEPLCFLHLFSELEPSIWTMLLILFQFFEHYVPPIAAHPVVWQTFDEYEPSIRTSWLFFCLSICWWHWCLIHTVLCPTPVLLLPGLLGEWGFMGEYQFFIEITLQKFNMEPENGTLE